jgi:hypothetical protein
MVSCCWADGGSAARVSPECFNMFPTSIDREGKHEVSCWSEKVLLRQARYKRLLSPSKSKRTITCNMFEGGRYLEIGR